MKNYRNITLMTKSILTIMLMMILTIGMANDFGPNFELQKKDGKIISINVHHQISIDFNLSIDDSFGHQLYKENYKDLKNLNKGYDLSTLPDGIYSLKVEDYAKISEWKIVIKGQKMQISEREETFIPKFFQHENMVEIKLDPKGNSNVEIMIYDNDGVELYNENYTENQKLQRIFDFSEVAPNNYFIRTTIGEKEFKFQVNE